MSTPCLYFIRDNGTVDGTQATGLANECIVVDIVHMLSVMSGLTVFK